VEMIQGLHRVRHSFIFSNRKLLTSSPLRRSQYVPAHHIIPNNDSIKDLKMNKSIIS